ncbi:MAG: FAD-binding protein [Elusimicrobia bacterium]|jgi:glycolate oxidase subunit GlcD|nr:FAD-binding protein [Elusimicrobiota bacterium]MBK7544606.1 FAD-binding protein [Elusimicrobiota bacterium]MBK7574138.1 FAD-binding protein [Elusimicrobiota bacterium]MBK8126266.1 FAD-binding protein [Elusimicrobiota bacterium]MBK8422427.1 FAD-binding protein [Elusimicrobiota bacterium]
MPDPFDELMRQSLGADRVLSAPGDLFSYAYDAALEKRLPGLVVLPRTAEEVALAIRAAVSRGIPFVARGAGTNLCGGTVAPTGGMVIHLSRLNRVLSIDEKRRRAWVEPGVVNLHLQKILAPRGLFYAPDPASQKACTLGGNVGTNAGGPHCLKYGVTSTHVLGLEVALPDGTLRRFSVDDPGPDLTALWVGSEGTLGVVTKIEINLLPQPPVVETFLAAFPSMEAAAQTVTDTIAAGVVPATLEVMDRLTVEAVEAFVKAGYPRDAEAVLLVEVDGDPARVAEEGERARAFCRKNGARDLRVATNDREREKLWEGRRGAYPAMARLAPNVLVEDGVVPRTKLPEAVRAMRAIADRAGVRMGLIAHAGDGNLHPNMVFDERDAGETARVKAAGQEMLRACVDLGGSISGEHGIGSDKRAAMTWLFSPETLGLFGRIKAAVDPAHLSNPHKILPTTTTVIPAAAVPAGPVWRPTSAAEAELTVRWAAREKQAFVIGGTGHRLAGEASLPCLDTTALNRVLRHDPGNLVLTVEAGATLADVDRALTHTGQHLHAAGEGTLGGILSRNACRSPRLRDQILAMTVLLADGTVVRFGAPVMKNVAGYDAAKLFIGAWGALGVILDVTFRLHAAPAVGEAVPAPRPEFWNRDDLAPIKKAFDPENRINPVLFERP